MSYITTKNINSINAELTNYCNAACPMCARYFLDGKVKDKIINNAHTSLDFLIEKIPFSVIQNLDRFRSCGNLGDGAMNPECLQIFEYVRRNNQNVQLMLHSNGGLRSKEFWQELAKLKVSVLFAIDGLEDTNHLYRRNVKWDKLIANVEAYIGAGGRADWDMLVFKHNEHQVEECKTLSKKLGFKNFNYKNSSRWADYTSAGKWIDVNSIKVDNYVIEKSSAVAVDKIGSGGNSERLEIIDNFKSKKIKCQAFDRWIEIYIAANGDISPCCWLGDLKMHEAKNIIKDYNTVNLNYSSLDEILQGDFFNTLWQGIQGKEKVHRLLTCYFTCGLN